MRGPKKLTLAIAIASVITIGGAGAAIAATAITGDDGPNYLVGTDQADEINGLRGQDELRGLDGNDRLRGGSGADDIYGGPGNDRINGGGGADDIDGNGGNDRITGGSGPDDIYGGPGNDRIRAVDRHEDDISCGSGYDTVLANPGDDVASDCEEVIRQGIAVGDASEPAPSGGDVISRAEAGQIAAAHVNGVVDSISREDDYGAAWDVDVYAPNAEYTIYVSATGEIVRVEGPFPL